MSSRRLAGLLGLLFLPVALTAEESGAVKAKWSEYREILGRLTALEKARRPDPGRDYIVNSVRYSAVAEGDILRVTADVSFVVLAGPEKKWVSVPVVAGDVAVEFAQVGVTEAGLVPGDDGYLHYLAERSGSHAARIGFSVPAARPSGGDEFRFRTVLCPVTRFACQFPRKDMKPHVEGAREVRVFDTEVGTRIEADLGETAEVRVRWTQKHEAEAREARIRATLSSLVSFDEGEMDVSTQVTYEILYAAVSEFTLFVPEELVIVLADGEGAFDYEVVPAEGGSLLRGSVGSPVEGRYEMSVQTRRAVEIPSKGLAIPLIEARDVDRETRYVGMEVSGNLSLSAEASPGVRRIDARELPAEVLEGTANPILYACRATRTGREAAQPPKITVSVDRYGECEVAPGAIEHCRFVCVYSTEGESLAQVTCRLRNNLRSALAFRLPEGARVMTAHVNGEAAKPAKDGAGRVLVPLVRSVGEGGELEPFDVELVYGISGRRMILFGRRVAVVPRVDARISHLDCEIYVPGHFGLRRRIDRSDRPAGWLSWGQEDATGVESARPAKPAEGGGLFGRLMRRQASLAEKEMEEFAPENAAPIQEMAQQRADVAPDMALEYEVDETTGEAVETGILPVRIDVPLEGSKIALSRWLFPADAPLRIGFFYWVRWARHVFLLLFVAAGFFLPLALERRGPAYTEILRAGWKDRLVLAGTPLALFLVLRIMGALAGWTFLLGGVGYAGWRIGRSGEARQTIAATVAATKLRVVTSWRGWFPRKGEAKE